ncbi:MAG: hypothetical protein C4523_01530 [Myxococcales bacterium]|nr:MAG: hypothetical protein C4523_01530 [Myxococcales bacterium]
MAETEKIAAIMFADIMNSSEYANVMSTTSYHNFIIKCLQGICADEAVYFNSAHPEYKPLPEFSTPEQLNQDYTCQFRTVGDEIRVFLYSGDEYADTNNLLEIAVRMKLRWLFSDFNKTRIKQNKAPEDLAIGIHTGPVVIESNKPEGFAMNVGKRIEGECRNGNLCRILLHANSVNFIQAYQKRQGVKCFLAPQFSPVWTFSGKGIAQEIPIRELKFFTFLGQSEVLRFLDVDPKYFIKHLFAASTQAPYPHFIYSTILSALQKLGIDDYTFSYIEDLCTKVYQYLPFDDILDLIIQVYEYRYKNNFKTMGIKEKLDFLQMFYRWTKENDFGYRFMMEDILKEQAKLAGSFKRLQPK